MGCLLITVLVTVGECVERRRRQRKAVEAVAYVLHAAGSWAQLRASPLQRTNHSLVQPGDIGGRPRDLR